MKGNLFRNCFLVCIVFPLLVSSACGLFSSYNLKNIYKKYGSNTLIGKYAASYDGGYCGISLELKPDSTFKAQEWGCFGKSGELNGTWNVEDSSLLFTVLHEKGSVFIEFEKLLIKKQEGSWAIIKTVEPHSNEYEVLDENGSICFKRIGR